MPSSRFLMGREKSRRTMFAPGSPLIDNPEMQVRVCCFLFARLCLMRDRLPSNGTLFRKESVGLIYKVNK